MDEGGGGMGRGGGEVVRVLERKEREWRRRNGEC